MEPDAARSEGAWSEAAHEPASVPRGEPADVTPADGAAEPAESIAGSSAPDDRAAEPQPDRVDEPEPVFAAGSQPDLAAEPEPAFAAGPAPVVPVPGAPPPRSGGPGRLFGYLLAGVAGVVLTIAVLVGSGSIGTAATAPTAPPTSAPTPPPTPAPTFGLDGSTMGVASAPVTIEIWADFQCPYCGLLAHGIEPALIRELAVTGKARIEYRDFAFLGQESIDAAVAARCAGQEGRFWLYHDLLFASQSGENQGAFARDRLLSLASFAGIADTAAFTTCLDDPAFAREVAAETQEGRSFGIDSTPTLRIVGPGPTQLLKGVVQPAEIMAALGRASAPSPTSSPGSGSSPGPSPSPS
jgi:protein-disulfide isomerase